jgi:hypothetical protein
MENVKPAVYTALCQVATNVSDVYPTDWATFPIVQYTLEQNKERTTLLDGTEADSYIRIKVDVWDKGSTSSMCANVTTKMKSLGYVRTDYMDVPDPSGLHHSLLRFEIIKE